MHKVIDLHVLWMSPCFGLRPESVEGIIWIRTRDWMWYEIMTEGSWYARES